MNTKPLFTKNNIPLLSLQNKGLDDMKLEDMSPKEMTILQTILMYKKTPRIEDAEKLLDCNDSDIEYRRRIRSNSSSNSSNGHRKRNQRIFQISKNKKK